MKVEHIIAKFDQIRENIQLIEKNLSKSFVEFEKLGIVKDGIYRRFEYSVELVIDILSLINAELKLGIPNGTSDIIDQLLKNEILDEGLADIIRGMKGFRNILVHRYGKLDDKLAYKIIVENLSDFQIVENQIMTVLRKMQE
ncbi:MAG: DUF86 domain-containing protein [Candidatus Heimdallarchaeota archaeon]|nr:DUF86 domain-containing protein [Candidatus Heimdallarchaeota archaeon]